MWASPRCLTVLLGRGEPGITRDRLYGETVWQGRRLRIVDTGGIVPDDKDFIPGEIFRQARLAFEEAAAVVLVVDVRTELAAPDMELARLLRRLGKPLFLAVNKVDSTKLEAEAENFRTLGIENLYMVSAEHGTGSAELLDAILDAVPSSPAEIETAKEEAIADEKAAADAEESGEEVRKEKVPRETRVAIIGHPNVGKSTLLNV